MSAELVKNFLGGFGLLLLSMAWAIDWHEDTWLGRSVTVAAFVAAVVAIIIVAIGLSKMAKP